MPTVLGTGFLSQAIRHIGGSGGEPRSQTCCCGRPSRPGTGRFDRKRRPSITQSINRLGDCASVDTIAADFGDGQCLIGLVFDHWSGSRSELEALDFGKTIQRHPAGGNCRRPRKRLGVNCLLLVVKGVPAGNNQHVVVTVAGLGRVVIEHHFQPVGTRKNVQRSLVCI